MSWISVQVVYKTPCTPGEHYNWIFKSCTCTGSVQLLFRTCTLV